MICQTKTSFLDWPTLNPVSNPSFPGPVSKPAPSLPVDPKRPPCSAHSVDPISQSTEPANKWIPRKQSVNISGLATGSI